MIQSERLNQTEKKKYKGKKHIKIVSEEPYV